MDLEAPSSSSVTCGAAAAPMTPTAVRIEPEAEEQQQATATVQVTRSIVEQQEQQEHQATTIEPELQQEEQAGSGSSSVSKRPLRSSKKRAAEVLCREYVIQFKGNQSQRWDGKRISVDADWLEELYPEDLFPGRIVQLPWDGKTWRAVISSAPGSYKL